MPTFHTQLFFNNPINVSLQKGDSVYYVNTGATIPTTPTNGTQPGTIFQFNSSNIVFIGLVHDIIQVNNSIVCVFDCTQGVDCDDHLPNEGDFIMFSKDNAANMSSVLGYYAEVTMVNNSNEKAKLFAVSSNISESSK
tara:strand:+ start:50 stop:463 length:414 start_codon:yes stop_codon:yes gene_type:complete